MRGWVKILDVSFREFGDLKLTNEEATLYRVFEYFSPYWSREYAFPSSICTKNLVNHDYMVRALTFFGDSENLGGKSTY
jgi:hypothetical protein